jgi:hypothetical protein
MSTERLKLKAQSSKLKKSSKRKGPNTWPIGGVMAPTPWSFVLGAFLEL